MLNLRLLSHSYFVLAILAFSTIELSSQNSPIGQWAAHVSFNNSVSIADGDDKIFAASRASLMLYDPDAKSLESYTKVDGLSDISIQKVYYHKSTNQLLIGYQSGVIDLFKKGVFTRMDDIQRADQTGSKSINDFYEQALLCYVSTGFGVVVIDMVKLEVKETYILQENDPFEVYQLISDGSYFWAATQRGIFRASIQELNNNPKLNWTLMGPRLEWDSCNLISFFNGNVIVNQSVESAKDTVFRWGGTDWEVIPGMELFDNNFSFEGFKDQKIAISHDYNSTIHKTDYSILESIWTYKYDQGINPTPAQTVFDSDGIAWIADRVWGIGNQYGDVISASGPRNNICYAVYPFQDKIISLSGARNSSNGNNFYRSSFFHVIDDAEWKTYDQESLPGIQTNFDLIDLAGSTDKIYMASLGRGLVELKASDYSIQKVYNEQNSTFQEEDTSNNFYYVGISSVAIDKDQNLWATNTRVDNGLHVKTPEGNWYSFTIPPLANALHIRDMLITSTGQKWIQLLDGATPGILVFDDKGTFQEKGDDQWKLLTVGEGKGNLPSSRCFSMVEDLDGNIWAGTEEGLVVFYNPSDVFSSTFDGVEIIVEKDGYNEALMKDQNITAIAVDGANRKWLASEGVGVFLVSGDGKQEIHQFTAENSPLLSNFVTSIAIQPQTGEVFFASEDGLVSFRSDATEGRSNYDQAYVFPNPIKSGYLGQITMTGLMSNSMVKITDVTGNIVYETISNGGSATWDGKSWDGKRVHSGVYLIYCYSEDGSYQFAGKMVFING